MTFREAKAEIESSAIVIRLNVASGFKTFLRAIQSEHVVVEMQRMMTSKYVQGQVLARIGELSRLRVDRRYENPWDTALAVYLWLIKSADRNLSALSAEIVAQAPQCWWAHKLAHQLLSEREIRIESTAQAYSWTAQPVPGSGVLARDTDSAEIALDTALVSAPFAGAVQIHSVRIAGNLPQCEGIEALGALSSLAGTQSGPIVAANQELALAA